MKKKLATLLGVLVLSSVSFAATDISSSLNALEQKLQQLEKMEQAQFAQQEAAANAAAQKLETYRKMDATIDERIATIEANADVSIFNKEFKQKISEYKALKADLAKEIAKEEKIVENFELIKSLR